MRMHMAMLRKNGWYADSVHRSGVLTVVHVGWPPRASLQGALTPCWVRLGRCHQRIGCCCSAPYATPRS
jgi:hypothetical protein